MPQRRRYALLKQPFTLSSLGDVTTTSPSAGQLLEYDGSVWRNVNLSALSDLSEAIDDRVATLLVAGNNIDLTYDDGANTLTVDVEALTSVDISDFEEACEDYIGAAITAGNNIDVTYDDGAGTITIDVETLTSVDITDFSEAVDDRVASLLVEGDGIALTYTDASNTLDVEVDINSLTAESSVDSAADYFVMYDASATALRKVLGSNMPGGGGGGGSGSDVVVASPWTLAISDALDNDHTGWTSDNGTWSDTTGYMHTTTSGTTTNRIKLDERAACSNAIIEIEVYYDNASTLGGDTIAHCGIKYLWDGAGTGGPYMKLQWTNKSSSVTVGGENQALANRVLYTTDKDGTTLSAATDTWHKLRMVINHGDIAYYLNDVFVGTGYNPDTDTSNPSHIGLACYQGTFRFRNLKVWNFAHPDDAVSTATHADDGCLLKKTDDQSMSAATWTALTWGTEVRDDNGYADLATDNTIITIPEDGWYAVYAQIEFLGASATLLGISKAWSGTYTASNMIASSYQGDADGGGGRRNVSAVQYLTAGTELTVVGYMQSASTLYCASEEPGYFGIHRLGGAIAANSAGYHEFFEDFTNDEFYLTGGQIRWVYSTANGGAIDVNAAEQNHLGVVSISSGTSAYGISRFSIAAGSPAAADRKNWILPNASDGKLYFEVYVKPGNIASIAGSQYAQIALTNDAGSPDTMAVFCNSTSWYLRTTLSGTSTDTALSTEPTDGSWCKLTFVADSAGVDLYLNQTPTTSLGKGSLVASNTTNIPTGIMTIHAYVYNDVSSGTSLSWNIDWFRAWQTTLDRRKTWS